MGLREWGSGLEALAECYHKYVEKCVVEVGRTFQRRKKIRHPTMSASTYPYDIDLIAVNPNQRKVILISCSERWERNIDRTQREFEEYEKFMRDQEGLGFGNEVEVEKRIACVSISDENRRRLQERGIKVLEARLMLEQLLVDHRQNKARKRKGAHREPLLWLLQTLDKEGMLRK